MDLELQEISFGNNSLHMGIKPQMMGKERGLGLNFKKTCLLRRKDTFFSSPLVQAIFLKDLDKEGKAEVL